MDPQEELIRLIVLQLRRTAKSQAELIVELNRVGFGATRIAELVGTTANAVNVTLNKAKKQRARGG
jgi:hypothetical protein